MVGRFYVSFLFWIYREIYLYTIYINLTSIYLLFSLLFLYSVNIQRKIRTKIRCQKWEILIKLCQLKKIFLANICQKYIRGILGRIHAKIYM